MIEGLQPYPEYQVASLPWLDRCPKHWQIKRGKSYLECVDIRSKTGKEELLTVSSARGVVPRKSANVTMFKAASYVGYKLCWPGDLVINSLWAWAGGLGVSNYHGIISTAYSVYRPRSTSGIVPKYLHELVRSSAFNWELQVRSKGIWISRLQLTDTAFLDAPIPLPPTEEQEAIVRFLQHAFRPIDALIRTKRKLIALLNEQKQAVIHKAVTRGLDQTVSLNPSGIPSVGNVPNNWEIVPLATIARLKTVVNQTKRELLSIYLHLGVVRFSDVEEKRTNTTSEDLSKYQAVDPGDFVLNNQQAWRGSVGVSEYMGIVSPAYIVLSLTPRLLPKYANFLLRDRSMVAQYLVCSKGVGTIQRNLYWPHLKRVAVLIPPLEEQKAIVEQIEAEVYQFDAVISPLEREVELLFDYRNRLMADVVTGKLDVRQVASRLPDLLDESPDDTKNLPEDLDEDPID